MTGTVISMADKPPAVGHVVAGLYLRSLRQGLGISGTMAARLIRASAAKISRMETGRSPLRQQDVRKLLLHYNVGHRATLDAMHKLIETPESQRHHTSDLGPGWAERLRVCEQEATPTRIYTNCVIPRGLRTPRYHSHVQRSQHSDADTIEKYQIPANRDDQAATLIMDESVLHRTVASRPVMAEQLRYLYSAVRSRELRVRIVLMESGVLGPAGITTELSLDGMNPFLVAESYYVSYFNGSIGENLSRGLDALEAAAASPSDSAALIGRALTNFSAEGSA
ncbi:Scr1 family TA system antitoxin-like transcriptional regulator [Streptomyces sp. SBT349]|uniref:Scr1 family TA system antitoxin-like transcriptional regulator n=1 Tax=Streptomyces sp. SBT349 TaxID=1580539 RepID=UPI00099BBA75|nr:Scr1 family TA system antitoxin-like transcriptional regulator [Streptomyces sp. SBT349]